jgi:Flp pilus assembly protein TadD
MSASKNLDETNSQTILARGQWSAGHDLLTQGNYDAAKSRFRQAIRLRPDFPEAHYDLGLALSRQKRRREALAEYRIAAGLAPKHPIIHCNFADLLTTAGKNQEAIEECQNILSYQPDYADAFLVLAKNYKQTMQYEAMYDAALEYVRLKPDNPGAYVTLGNACILKDDHDKGIANYRKAGELDPQQYHPRYHIVWSYLFQGRYSRAIKELFRLW